MVRIVRFASLLLSAFALATTAAHVLELAPKMGLDLELYARVNGSLYRTFAIVGGAAIVAAIASSAAAAFLLRRRGGAPFRWAAAGAALIAAAFVSWIALVAPVNARVAAAAPAERPALWRDARPRWEYGHAVGFALHLLGFAALAWSALSDAARAPGGTRREPARAAT